MALATISSGQFGIPWPSKWGTSGTLKIIVSNVTFVFGTKTYVQGRVSDPVNERWCVQSAITVSAGVGTFAFFSLPQTDVGITVINGSAVPRYTGIYYDSKGVKRGVLFQDWHLSSSLTASFNFEAWAIDNAAVTVLNPRTDFLGADAVNNAITARLNAPATTTQNGIGEVDTPPIDPLHPTFVGVNSPLITNKVLTTDPRISVATGSRRIVANQFSGANLGAKINAAIAAMGTDVGVIELFGGGYLGASTIIVPPNICVCLHNGTYTSTSPDVVFALKDGASIRGDGWGTIIEESSFDSTGQPFLRPWTVVAAFFGYTNGQLQTSNLTVRDFQIRGANPGYNSATPTISLGNVNGALVTGMYLNQTRTIGINAGGTSGSGFYATGMIISNNLLVGVASQNISATNCDGVQIIGNIMRNPGQALGPGVTAIDVEPNVGDRTYNVLIANNTIDAVGSPVALNAGIAIQNGNGATPYGSIQAINNIIVGALHSNALGNNIGYGLLLRTTFDVTAKGNRITRCNHGITVDFSSFGNLLSDNELISCGTPSTIPFEVADSIWNRIYNNRMYSYIADNLTEQGAFGPYPDDNVKAIFETGTSDHNLFAGNMVTSVSIVGAHSKNISRNDDTGTNFDAPVTASTLNATTYQRSGSALALANILSMGNTAGNTVAGAATSYGTFAVVASAAQTATFSATESLRQMLFPGAVTLKNFYVVTSTAQPNDGALVLTVRKNGVDTGVTITIAAGAAAGTFSDTTHTLSVAAGDLISFSVVNASPATPSAAITQWAILSQ